MGNALKRVAGHVLALGLVAAGPMLAAEPVFQPPAERPKAGQNELPPPPELGPSPIDFSQFAPIFAKAPDATSQGEASIGKSREQFHSPPVSKAVKAILGFVALLVIAYIGGHPRVQRFERRLNIAHLVTTGLPFVVLGLIAHHPRVGVLSDSVLYEIAPLLQIGLGWIGFVIGFRFDPEALQGLPKGAGTAVFLTTAIPFAAIVAACGSLLMSTAGSLTQGAFIRDAMVLGTAGAMAARTTPQFLEALGETGERLTRVAKIIQLEQLAGVFGLMLVAAYFRPQEALVSWHLPGTAWLFIAIGIGATIGGLMYATFAKINKGPQFTVVMLGSICFAAGMASYLRLPAVAVCFIAGVVLVNFGAGWKEQVRGVLEHMERPVYFLFLIIAGALWRPGDWQGWLLLALFVGARLLGKWLGAVLLREPRTSLEPSERRYLMTSPLGALSIAIVVSAQDLYRSQTIAWIVTAVIGGAIVTEILLQFLIRRFNQRLWLISPRPASGDAQLGWSE